jgi:DNA-binding XRE family transcriptional regulator
MTKVTKRYTYKTLSAKQQKALNELLSGKTDEEAANIAGVSRKTVNTWKNEDPFFQAEFNRRKLEVWEDFLNELNLTTGYSMATIREAIKNGDVKTARWFFDKIGLLENI